MRLRPVRIRIVFRIASADRLVLAVAAVRAGREMLRRAHVDGGAAVRALVRAGGDVASGGTGSAMRVPLTSSMLAYAYPVERSAVRKNPNRSPPRASALSRGRLPAPTPSGDPRRSIGGCPRRTLLNASAGEIARPRGAGVPLGVEHEQLDGHAVRLRVDAAVERAYLPAGQPLDRLAELCHGRVLEEHAQVAQALML